MVCSCTLLTKLATSTLHSTLLPRHSCEASASSPATLSISAIDARTVKWPFIFPTTHCDFHSRTMYCFSIISHFTGLLNGLICLITHKYYDTYRTVPPSSIIHHPSSIIHHPSSIIKLLSCCDYCNTTTNNITILQSATRMI